MPARVFFMGLGCVIILVGIAFLFGASRLPRKPPSAPTGTPIPQDPIPQDSTPQAILDLEKELGATIRYESGREAFIKYGHEFVLYSRDGFGYAWADTLNGAISTARAEFYARRREQELKPERDQQERGEQKLRQQVWDDSHPPVH